MESRENTGKWLTTQLSDQNGESWRLLPMNHYLYSGLAGMLLLFYELKTAKRPQATKVYDTLKNENVHIY